MPTGDIESGIALSADAISKKQTLFIIKQMHARVKETKAMK